MTVHVSSFCMLCVRTVLWQSSTTAPLLRHQAPTAGCSYGWRVKGGQGCGAGGVKGREGHPDRWWMGAVSVPVALNEGGLVSLLLQGAEDYREEAGLEAEGLVMKPSCDISVGTVSLNQPCLS